MHWKPLLTSCVLIAATIAAPSPAAAGQGDIDLTVRAWRGVLADGSQPMLERIRACRELAKLGPRAQAAAPELLNVLRATDSIVIPVLDSLSGDHIGYTDAMLTLKVHAAWALDALAPDRQRILPVVLKLFNDLPAERKRCEARIRRGMGEDKWYDDTVYTHQLTLLNTALMQLLRDYGAAIGPAKQRLLEIAGGKVIRTDYDAIVLDFHTDPVLNPLVDDVPRDGWNRLYHEEPKVTREDGPTRTLGEVPAAIRLLGQIGATEAIEVIERAYVKLEDELDKQIAKEALRRLYAIEQRGGAGGDHGGGDGRDDDADHAAEGDRDADSNGREDAPRSDTGLTDAQTKAIVKALIAQLDDPDAAVRLQAANALARLGPKARSAVAALTLRANDPDATVREAVTRALAAILGEWTRGY